MQTKYSVIGFIFCTVARRVTKIRAWYAHRRFIRRERARFADVAAQLRNEAERMFGQATKNKVKSERMI